MTIKRRDAKEKPEKRMVLRGKRGANVDGQEEQD